MKVLIFGNPLLKQDSIPIKILPKLKQKFPKIEFKKIDPTEDLFPYYPHLTIIDTIKGIKKTIIINDIDKLKINKLYSMHDFDLALNLKLLKKLGKIESVKIIGVPININENKALNQISKILNKFKPFPKFPS